MLEMSKPYIAAFRNGQKEPVIEEDRVVYWYRPHLKSASCDSTDNCGGKPTGWEVGHPPSLSRIPPGRVSTVGES